MVNLWIVYGQSMGNLYIQLVVEPPLWKIWKSIGMFIPWNMDLRYQPIGVLKISHWPGGFLKLGVPPILIHFYMGFSIHQPYLWVKYNQNISLTWIVRPWKGMIPLQKPSSMGLGRSEVVIIYPDDMSDYVSTCMYI